MLTKLELLSLQALSLLPGQWPAPHSFSHPFGFWRWQHSFVALFFPGAHHYGCFSQAI